MAAINDTPAVAIISHCEGSSFTPATVARAIKPLHVDSCFSLFSIWYISFIFFLLFKYGHCPVR